MTTSDDARHARLEAAFTAYAPRVWAYARRHAEHDECDDLVAETFAIAWRRLDRMPPEPLPWLLVVARNVLANRRRTAERADRLWFAAVRELWTTADSPEHAVAERDELLRALHGCTRVEREALLLVAWDGLTPAQAAAVAGCSTRAFTVRLHRARRRLAAGPSELDAPPLRRVAHGLTERRAAVVTNGDRLATEGFTR